MMKVAVIDRSSQSSLMFLKATLPPVKALRWFSTAFQIMEERPFLHLIFENIAQNQHFA